MAVPGPFHTARSVPFGQAVDQRPLDETNITAAAGESLIDVPVSPEP
jgi:hypothetical protein